MDSAADQDFLRHADECLRKLLVALDAFDPDELEADLAGGVLKLAFADGRNCIANRQSAAHQIWLAEGASAWHFTRDAGSGKWMDTKGRGALTAILSEILTRRLGRPVAL